MPFVAVAMAGIVVVVMLVVPIVAVAMAGIVVVMMFVVPFVAVAMAVLAFRFPLSAFRFCVMVVIFRHIFVFLFVRF